MVHNPPARPCLCCGVGMVSMIHKTNRRFVAKQPQPTLSSLQERCLYCSLSKNRRFFFSNDIGQLQKGPDLHWRIEYIVALWETLQQKELFLCRNDKMVAQEWHKGLKVILYTCLNCHTHTQTCYAKLLVRVMLLKQSVAQNYSCQNKFKKVLLMEEILHDLGCIKPCN